MPKITSQLVLWRLLEDLNLSEWQQALATATGSGKTAPPLAQQISSAVDAVDLLKQFARDRALALSTDPELKFRALRDPLARRKAMRLYGIELSTAAGAPVLPPDLGTLLAHESGRQLPVLLAARTYGAGGKRSLMFYSGLFLSLRMQWRLYTRRSSAG